MQTVPGAELRYRLTGGESSALPVLVFENGWGASFHMWSWVQRELEPHARLLLYCRAGVGGSVVHGTQTVEGMSSQLAALLDALHLDEPVVVVGQSYGGLVGAAHAVQIPGRARALVQVDPAVDRPDPVVDAGLKPAAALAKVTGFLASVGLPDPLLSPATHDLPDDDGEELRRSSFRSADSMRASEAELALLPELREVATGNVSQPRLVISAMRHAEMANPVLRRLVPTAPAEAVVARARRSHRLTARRGGPGSRWEELPHTHGGLVFTRSGAQDTAASTLRFVQELV